jgi:cation diffusion facilitator CzcD-associated flavoprotein CzcO
MATCHAALLPRIIDGGSALANEYFDVVIVGAGLSGIGAAWHLQDQCPGKSYLILEGRESLGGTWDLFRYPGIRSDSDMYTLGYNFKPWRDGKSIADGPSILRYVQETAAESGIDRHIRYRHRLTEARWSGKRACWTLTVLDASRDETVSVRCGFLMMCAGYYSYQAGYTPEFAGRERFRGRIVHPQAWPDDLDYRGKQVVVVGSGATAVTLIPEMASDAAHVVMLQRSPTYMVSMPDVDRLANLLRALLPEKLAYAITRWKNIRFQQFIYRQTRKSPERVRRKLLKLAQKELGPDCDFDSNFVPRYKPWDQRLCLVPNADFFHAVRDGKASVVTDRIDAFTENGVLLESGRELPADIIVTATGLDLCVMGGASFYVDGMPVDFATSFSYKSMMFSDVPNLVSTFGYINASWTLKADLTAEFACRVINHLDETGNRMCVPRLREEDRDMPADDWIRDFSSGYIQRKMHLLPRQGDRAPWINTQNYALDRKIIHDGPIEDGVLTFGSPAGTPASESAVERESHAA